HDAEGVEIGLAARALAAPDLGCHVQWGSYQAPPRMRGTGGDLAIRRSRRGRRGGNVLRGVAVHDRRETEVEELGAALVGEVRVRWLDIAEEGAAPVCAGEPAREVERDIENVPPRHRALDLTERATV